MPPFQQQKSLKELCTFGIGGTARFFVEVRTIPEMQMALRTCKDKKIPFFILGKGSNCLFSDQGFDGLVILNKIDFVTKEQPEIFHVGAGYSFSLLGAQTARQGWTGLEFASGIPASVGGAVFMNAGANGTETWATLLSVDFVNPDGILQTFTKEQLEFSYRFSSFHHLPGAIVGAKFKLEPSTSAREKQLQIIHYRKATQPYGHKSAGCIFRNPACGYAGALIQESGLKGVTFGGAQISTLHANFIINSDNATAKDVLTLISHIQDEVYKKTGILLESEVRIVQTPDQIMEK